MKEEIKNEKIKTLGVESFRSLVITLISKLGYIDIIEQTDCVIAKTDNPLARVAHGFIFPEISEDGKLLAVESAGKIRRLRTELGFATASLISTSHFSNLFEKELNAALGGVDQNLTLIGRERIIQLIDTKMPDYWKHDDLELLDYEKQYRDITLRENEIKKLKIFNEKYQKLLDIFIDPRITHFYEDPITSTPTRKRVSLEFISHESKPLIISGDAGTGKTTMLKRIGELMINRNPESVTRNIPVFITTVELFDAEYKISKVLTEKIKSNFKRADDDIFKEYNVQVLIDSIDEFDEETQKKIINRLEILRTEKGVNYVIATRSFDRIVANAGNVQLNTFYVEKFNTDQVKQFIQKFFIGQNTKAESLIEALRENKILEKLPITPLTLSLISILFEENDLEIPATISDIYDNFNALLLGKALVSSRIELIDVSFRERILSLYALELLNRDNHTPMTREEFIKYFNDYFASKTIPIRNGTLTELLEYLIHNTGILILKHGHYVQFSHDSFMEYYGAMEIFKHQRDQEDVLAEKFFENNWQNAAIFYAGKSKDMPLFLEKIIKRLKKAKNVNDFFSGVIGAGYLLQALYQTDNKIRKQVVDEALNLNIQAHEFFMKLAGDNNILFKRFQMPVLWMINLLYFYENFNSITLKEPMKLSFQDGFGKFIADGSTVEGYKSIKLALTLNSRRINETHEIELLLENRQLLTNPTLGNILEVGAELTHGNNFKDLKKEVGKEFKKLDKSVKDLLQKPASRMRFSMYDEIRLKRDFVIVTEGETDAEILEHAFVVLSGGDLPYWNVSPAGNLETGGASEVAKSLLGCKPVIGDGKFIFGLFDHDDKGLQEYRGLKSEIFVEQKKDTIKKHQTCNAFGICLPIPGELIKYSKKDQRFNFFSLEHYFGEEYLRTFGALRETEIPDVFAIKDSKKKELARAVRQINDPKFFVFFIDLFEEIDRIAGHSIEYRHG